MHISLNLEVRSSQVKSFIHSLHQYNDNIRKYKSNIYTRLIKKASEILHSQWNMHTYVYTYWCHVSVHQNTNNIVFQLANWVSWDYITSEYRKYDLNECANLFQSFLICYVH